MIKRIRITLIAILAAVGLISANALSASATTYGGLIYNGSTSSIIISPDNPPGWVTPNYPGHWSSEYIKNVQCFNPLINVRSQYGGLYYGGVWRCMSGNNITLKFHNA